MQRFAIVGCGRIAKRHAEILTSKIISGACLVAVCDCDGARARQFSETYSVPHFTDMHEMMKSSEMDVVIVLTPSGTHAKNVLELAQYKKHIVVEKPMALTLNDADSMIETCDRAGIRLFVVKQNRFNLPVAETFKAIRSGRLGKLFMGTVRVRWSRDQSYYNQDNWRGTWAQDGGVLTNQAAHHIDLLLWLMGDVESVFAKSANFGSQIEAEDTGVVLIKFTNGALGTIEATTATRPDDLEGSISILGNKGSIEIGGFAVNQLKHWKFVEPLPEDDKIISTCSENPPDVYGFGHRRYLEHVVECLEHNQAMLVDGLEGRRSVELINAIYESIETNREVTVRFQPKHCRLGIHESSI